MEKLTKEPSRLPTITRSQLATLDDLQALKAELRDEILKGVRAIVHDQPATKNKKWLKSREVLKLLGVCPVTLQKLRDNGTIPFSQLGRDCYYDPDDINREIEKRKGLGRNRSGQFIQLPTR